MLLLSNGELLIYGFTESTAGGRDVYAVRVSQEGAVTWEYTVESPGEELVMDALETPEGGSRSRGEHRRGWRIDETRSRRQPTVGAAVMNSLAGSMPSQVAQTGDGGFLLSGFSMNSSPRQADTWLARWQSDGGWNGLTPLVIYPSMTTPPP